MRRAAAAVDGVDGWVGGWTDGGIGRGFSGFGEDGGRGCGVLSEGRLGRKGGE